MRRTQPGSLCTQIPTHLCYFSWHERLYKTRRRLTPYDNLSGEVNFPRRSSPEPFGAALASSGRLLASSAGVHIFKIRRILFLRGTFSVDMSRRRSSVCSASMEPAPPSVNASRRSTCGQSGIGIGVQSEGSALGLAYLSVRESGAVVEISDAAVRLCGYDNATEIVGQHVSLLWPALKGAASISRRVLEGTDGFQWTRKKDGSRICTCIAESYEFGSASSSPATSDAPTSSQSAVGVDDLVQDARPSSSESVSSQGRILPHGESVITIVLVDGTELERVRSSNPFVDANFAILQISKWGKIELVPPCSGGLLGMRPHSLVGRSIMEFIPEEDLSYFCRQMDSIFHSGFGTLHLTMIRKTSLVSQSTPVGGVDVASDDQSSASTGGCDSPRNELVEVELWARVKDDTIICLVSEGPCRDTFLSRGMRDYEDVQMQLQRMAVTVWQTAHASRLFRVLEFIKSLLVRTAVRGLSAVFAVAEGTYALASSATPHSLLMHVPMVKQIAYYLPHYSLASPAPLLITAAETLAIDSRGE
eukprot:Opistho-2@9109